MTELPDHHCPGCGTARRAFPRYPWHFCNDCRARATDGSGRALDFANASMSGGLTWRYADEDIWHDAGTVICLIGGRPVMVREARFGGVVAEPIPDRAMRVEPYNLVDLRRRST